MNTVKYAVIVRGTLLYGMYDEVLTYANADAQTTFRNYACNHCVDLTYNRSSAVDRMGMCCAVVCRETYDCPICTNAFCDVDAMLCDNPDCGMAQCQLFENTYVGK